MKLLVKTQSIFFFAHGTNTHLPVLCQIQVKTLFCGYHKSAIQKHQANVITSYNYLALVSFTILTE